LGGKDMSETKGHVQCQLCGFTLLLSATWIAISNRFIFHDFPISRWGIKLPFQRAISRTNRANIKRAILKKPNPEKDDILKGSRLARRFIFVPN
jgi:hypothetical protein